MKKAKDFFEDLRKKIGIYFYPEKIQPSRALIFTVDKIDGNTVCYAIDFGKTFYIVGMDTSDEFSKVVDMDKYLVESVNLEALRITQRREGKNGT